MSNSDLLFAEQDYFPVYSQTQVKVGDILISDTYSLYIVLMDSGKLFLSPIYHQNALNTKDEYGDINYLEYALDVSNYYYVDNIQKKFFDEFFKSEQLRAQQESK